MRFNRKRVLKKATAETVTYQKYLLKLYHLSEVSTMNSTITYDLLKKQIAEEILDEIKEMIKDNDLANQWVNQKALVEEHGYSLQIIKRMEDYGLKSFKKGKNHMYCLADVNEILHLMKN